MSILENKRFLTFYMFLCASQLACRESGDRREILTIASEENDSQSGLVTSSDFAPHKDLDEQQEYSSQDDYYSEDAHSVVDKGLNHFEQEEVQAPSMISGSYLTSCSYVENKSNVICQFDDNGFEEQVNKQTDEINIAVIVEIDGRYLTVEYVLHFYPDAQAWEIKIPLENFDKPETEWTYCYGKCSSDDYLPEHDVLVEIDGSQHEEQDLSILITKEHTLFGQF